MLFICSKAMFHSSVNCNNLLYINLQKKSRQRVYVIRRKFIGTFGFFLWGGGRAAGGRGVGGLGKGFTCKSDGVPVVPVLYRGCRITDFGLTIGIPNGKLIFLPVILSLSNLCWRMVFSNSQMKPRAEPRFFIFIKF